MKLKRDNDYWTLTSVAGKFTFPKGGGNILSQCKLVRDTLTASWTGSLGEKPKDRARPNNAVAYIYANLNGPANHTHFQWELPG